MVDHASAPKSLPAGITPDRTRRWHDLERGAMRQFRFMRGLYPEAWMFAGLLWYAVADQPVECEVDDRAETDVVVLENLARAHVSTTAGDCPKALAPLLQSSLEPLDDWRGAYRLYCEPIAQGHVRVCSAGPDGRWLTPDDICSNPTPGQ